MGEFSNTAGKVVECLAAVSWGPNQDLSIEKIEVHPPQKGEVRIKILYCGICHSDIHGMKGEMAGANYPSILGHEASGIIESVGEGIKFLKAGDKVVPLFNPECNECMFCKDPSTNFCADINLEMKLKPDGSSRYTCKGQNIHQFAKLSTFSQYIVTLESSCVKVDDDTPLNTVCLLSCGVPTGYGAAVNVAQVKPGSTCAVWGLGTIGLAAVMGCKANGASRIIGIDYNPLKEKTGKIFGVTDFVNPKDHKAPIQQVIKGMTGIGCDFTFECVGNVAAVKAAFESCRVGGGKCVVVGVCPPTNKLELNSNDFLSSRTMVGCLYGGYSPREGVPNLWKCYKEKKLLLDEFITGEMSLQDINKAVDLLLQGKALRTIIKMFP